jgi:hypothetical protein
MNFEVFFHIPGKEFPAIEEQFATLWRFARFLTKYDIALDCWHPAAPTEEESLRHKAFDDVGPTTSAISLAKYINAEFDAINTVGAWNGIEDAGGLLISEDVSIGGICRFEFDFDGVIEKRGYSVLADIVEAAVKLWPATCVQVGPHAYYLDPMQVFPDRPGVGWMLYLPHEISQDQVPEAHMLRYVTDLNGHKGTIIISEIDGVFDADNPAHVHVANKIEIRLADRGLLPKYADL